MPEQAPAEGGGRRRTTRLAVVLLLLLLLAVASMIYQNLMNRPLQKAMFLQSNAKCLVCHSEKARLLDSSSVHFPFMQQQCEGCHTNHGDLFERRVREAGLTGEDFRRACGPFIPVAAVQRLLERLLGRKTAGEWQTTQQAKEQMKDSLLYRPFKQSRLRSETELALCMTCHGNLGGLWKVKYRHNPFVRGHCTSCHNPHATEYRPLLQADVRDLCTACHPMAKELAKAQLHPPFELLSCTSCHGPHASDYKILLRKPQKILCLACHPTVAPLTAKSIQHRPFAEGDCTGCHEPHSAPVKPLLPSAQPGFCYKCHPALQADFNRASHHPVGTLIDCTSCHLAHAGDYSWLLLAEGNEMCYACHYEKRIPYVYTAHNEVEYTAIWRGACVNCHVAHGSDWGPLLAKEELELCWTCHPSYSGKTSHPVKRYTYAWHTKGKLLCTSSCHDPHGTQYRNMLLRLPDGLCLACHPVAELP